jgi:hypothetical protein
VGAISVGEVDDHGLGDNLSNGQLRDDRSHFLIHCRPTRGKGEMHMRRFTYTLLPALIFGGLVQCFFRI